MSTLSCSCGAFRDLELVRKDISKRIKESRQLRTVLDLVCSHSDAEQKLYQCKVCGTLWQGSRAWNWGNDEYLFTVPPITLADWQQEVFVQPDELLIFVAVIGEFWDKNRFDLTEEYCRTEGCQNNSIVNSVLCPRHHMESLQHAHMLPATPTGRWFPPYKIEGILPPPLREGSM